LIKRSIIQKQGIILKAVVIILILITWLISINFSCRNYKIFNILTWLFPYIAILILLSLFKKYKIIRVLYTLLWIPGLILAATGPFIQTIGSLIFTYITILGGTCILVFILPKEVFNYHIVFEAGVYLVLTISSIAATTFSEQLIKNWHNAQNKEYKDFSEKLSLKLFGQNKIRFIIFIFYFILLTIFTFSKLNRISILEQHNLDIAILQSFATYVAFDRVVSNWDKLKNGLSK
jgi:hypothetical protein